MRKLVVTGRCLATPPPVDWREQLAQLLGAKPRRIGNWAELGLYGAMRCLADAGEKALPPDAMLMLTSRRGTHAATGSALAQMGDGLPMPLTFLQTQPSQLLALLAAQMSWSGPACFLATAQPQDLLRLVRAQMGQGGVLLGCVDETDGGSSNWLRLCPGAPQKHDFSASFLAWTPSANGAHGG